MKKGEFLSEAVAMKLHQGYITFDELKYALVKALKSSENELLKIFVDKIAPSSHLLYFLRENIFSRESLEASSVDIEAIKTRYFNLLLKFKQGYCNTGNDFDYDFNSLTNVTDFTHYKNSLVTNSRNTDHAFSNVKYLEKILRNAVKVNGYWISSYFMHYRY